MQYREVGPHDYDSLSQCPFCPRRGLLVDAKANCQHFVAAFQEGLWHPRICPPVFCDGFRFEKQRMLEAIASMALVVNIAKPGTRRHPRIRVYYCALAAFVQVFRKKYRRVPTAGPRCTQCHNDTAVVDDVLGIICALCGSPAILPDGYPEHQVKQ
jgi:hypothetical protein